MNDLFAGQALSTKAPKPFQELEAAHYAAILADPPWKFEHWGKDYVCDRDPENYYPLMSDEQLGRLPVNDLATKDCVLFLWITWPKLEHALWLIERWRFEYKTCAFSWTKANVATLNMFDDAVDADMGLGYWTRANSEVCLLATRGQPKRLNADVRQGIIEPRRQHSRKPSCVHERIERLVSGPYLELFARATRPGWTSWGNETTRFSPAA
jgi:N6-adenosine-specific RNA methylase IME4